MSANVIVRWNELLLEAAQKAPPSRVPVFRNLALESVAVYDAVNAIDRSYAPYFANVQASRGASEDAAAAQAAHDTAVVLYPQQQAVFDAELAADLAGIPLGRAQQGIDIGQAVVVQPRIISNRGEPLPIEKKKFRGKITFVGLTWRFSCDIQ